MISIKDRIAIVTGASSGIGWGIAKAIAAEGAVTVLAARSTDKLEKLAAEIEAEGGRAFVVPTDVTDDAQVEKLFATVKEKYGRLDIRDEAGIVRLVQSAAGAMGRACATRGTGGGSDANVFVERGLEVANLACGMREIHTVNEWVDVRDLVLTAGLLVETVRLNAAA